MTNNYYQIHYYRINKLFEEIKNLQLPSGGKVLDIGCYPPYLSDWLKKQGFDVFGVSSDHEKIQDPKVSTLNIETEDFPYKDNTFDLVVLTEVIEHLSNNPVKLLQKIKKILRPGGHLIITTPNAGRLQNIISLIFNKNIYFPIYQMDQNIYFRHQREYVKPEMDLVISQAGLDKFKSIYYTAYPPFRTKNKSDSLPLKLIKWFTYLVSTVIPIYRDSMLTISTKKR